MHSKKLIHLLKCCLTIAIIITIQNSYCQLNKTYFHELRIEGIPFNKNVNVLFEDSIGYLWIGTKTGLYRYDGNNLIAFQFDVFDPNSIPNNSINSIIEDSHKNLWIGSESYLIHYNREESIFKGFYKNNTAKVLYKDTNGHIWANLKNIGLVLIKSKNKLDKTEFNTHFNYENNPNLRTFNKTITSFIDDDFGRHWLGTAKGIFALNNDKKYIQTNFNKQIVSLKKTTNNRIIAITNNELYILGYNKTNLKLEILEHYKNFNSNTSNVSFNSISLSPKSEDIWLGSTNGLFKANRNNNKYKFNYFSKASSKSNLINSTIFDSYGNLWIGSLKGISKYIGESSIFDFNKVNTGIEIDNLVTNSIFYYSSNNILLGTNKGLYHYNKNQNIYTKVNTGLTGVRSISQNYEKDKLLIVGRNSLHEAENYKPNKQTLALTNIKSYKKDITDIAVINKNEIWVGLWSGGVDIINSKNQISKFKKDVITKLTNHHVFVFLLTEDNKLWIGTRGQGLFKVDFNNETIEQYLPSKEYGLTSNAILSLFEDKNKTIWIGTRGGGLNQYIEASNTFKYFGKHNGLASNTICAIKEDLNNNIWISSHDGLIRFDTKKEEFISFGIEDGIQESEFIFKSSAVNSTLDNIYFGCFEGFYTVNTNKFMQKKTVPSTVITKFSTLGASEKNKFDLEVNASSQVNFNSKTSIVLPYNQNNILVNFSSLDLTFPNKNQYAYMLEGLNDYWVYTNASNRNANYNDLNPGEYTFKVKSTNSDGIWNETPTILKFSIEPPFWKSNTAILLYWILSISLLLISSILIRRWYQLKKNLVKETISREKDNEHNRMKMTFFTDISHELRTPLSLILGTIEKVVKEKKFTLNPLTSQRIYNNTLRMHRLINQIMDIRKFDDGKLKLNISKNNIIHDINIIKNAFNDFAKTQEIDYNFITNEEETYGWYDVDILEKILFNLLSNAFKYTKEKGRINITTRVATYEDLILNKKLIKKGKYIKCSVKDDGIGIPKSDLDFIFNRYYQATKPYTNQIPGTGIGMELVQKLVERHYGTIEVKSEENIYTEFTFYLPINKNRYREEEILEKGVPLTKSFIKNSEFQIIEEIASGFDEKTHSKKSSKPNILIVEDNPDLRQMLKEELKTIFYVLEASNGQEGYNVALKEKPQLIISDILMPVEDGISMLKRIKNNSEINNIPIFMLTAKSSNETKIESLSLGAEDYIEKPFSLEFVKWKVRNALITRKELKEKYSKIITSEPSEIKMESNNEKFLKKLIKIIENSMDDNILSVEYLASEVGMSRANLYRKLKLIINDTPVNFIKKIKLKRAAQLLKKNDMYISEIAYMTGFNNQKYFSKCFHKEYGMSPTVYIKKHTNQNLENKIISI